MGCYDRQVILVDFFDTTMFRNVLPEQAALQWVLCLKKKYQVLQDREVTDLLALRRNVFAGLKSLSLEPTFAEAMDVYYHSLSELHNSVSASDFVNTACRIDQAVEYGCQYPNRALVRWLEKKKTQGKTIVCVSDFYHDSACLRKFLHNANISENLFNKYFVSCECGRSKANGTLYPYVLERLGISGDQAVMIGDTYKSDYVNAQKAGIEAVLKRHMFHKGKLHLKKKVGLSFAKRQMKTTAHSAYRYGIPFSEYVLAFYCFTCKLYQRMYEDGVEIAAFMAREGYYLQVLFERYLLLCVPDDKAIKAKYLRCSRRSIFAGTEEGVAPESNEPMSLRNWLKSVDLTVDDIREYVQITEEEADEARCLPEYDIYLQLLANSGFSSRYHAQISENHRRICKYMQGYLDKGRLNIVDSGWRGTTQYALKRYYNIPSTSYFVGVLGEKYEINDVVRHGLLFEEGDGALYDYIGMNAPFYQQLLSAPHGCAIRYEEADDGTISVVERWDEGERTLYETWICKLQKQMTTLFEGLCAWNINTPLKQDWIMAKTVFHSNMFAYGRRYDFLKACEDAFFVNFRQEKRGAQAKNYNYKEVQIGFDLIIKPEKYIRYITKIQRSPLYEKKIVRFLYPPLARCYYGYVLMMHLLKPQLKRINEQQAS